jgi:hypothetical protein
VEKQQKLKEQIQCKTLGKTGANDMTFITLLEIKDLLLEQTELLRQLIGVQIKLPVAETIPPVVNEPFLISKKVEATTETTVQKKKTGWLRKIFKLQ